MIESLFITLLPLGFLVVLFGGGEHFRRKHVDMDGDAPIGKTLFVSSKYMILVVWAGMVAHGWGVDLSFTGVPGLLEWTALCLWGLGFALLFAGRFEMGSSFRIGSPREHTDLRVDGLFRFSRNPMYLGVYATLLASVLYTLNVLLAAIVAYVIIVHHRIVLAEERYLQVVFGEQYEAYRDQVRRYV